MDDLFDPGPSGTSMVQADVLRLVRDWWHAWLYARGWDALAVWEEARWSHLEPDEKLAFAIECGGWPANIDHPTATDEHGDLVRELELEVHAYCHDPEIPTHMQTPHVHLDRSPW